jgi:hypothetical protein
MPHWLIKSGIQRVISWLPASAYWNELFQRTVTRSIDLNYPAFLHKLEGGARFYDRFRRVQPGSKEQFTVMELGTGWYPVNPITLYLCGAEKIHSYDIIGHLQSNRLSLVLDYFCKAEEDGSLRKIAPQAKTERIAQVRDLRKNVKLETPESCLARVNIQVIVGDACNSGLPGGSIDLSFSNGVLEYVPSAVLPKMLAEFRRVASGHSVTIHWMNLRDEFATFDRNISDFNYLRYTDKEWTWRQSPLVAVNRYRIPDYRELYPQAGFELKLEENVSGALDRLKTVPLAPRFQKYSTEDLLVLETLIAAVPRTGSAISR